MEQNIHCQQVGPVFQEYEGKLEAFIRKRVSDEEDSKDLLQQVLLKLFRHCEKLEAVKNMQAWVYQLTRNTLNDYYRETARKQAYSQLNEFGETAGLADQQEENIQKEMLEYIRPMIELLKPMYSQPLIMSDLEGISQQQIADHLGISLSGAKSRIQRAREQLRELMLECFVLETSRDGQIVDMEVKGSCQRMLAVKRKVKEQIEGESASSFREKVPAAKKN